MPQTQQPLPQGRYRTASRIGQIIFTADMTPRKEGQLIKTGPVDSSTDLHQYSKAARLAAANALVAAQSQLKPNESILKIASMTVFIAAHPSFTHHSKIADFSSDYLIEMLGDNAICSRAAVGVSSLPCNAPIEITLIAEAGYKFRPFLFFCFVV